MMDTKTFPIQSDYRDTKAHPTRIPWEVADKAYAVYRGRYGSQQTLERLAERGGFSGGEMDEFYPGWRDEVSGIAVRDARITALETALAAMTAERDESGRRLGEFQLRLAGALIASEGGNGCPDGAIECIRTCPTIASVMRLRAERDALKRAVMQFVDDECHCGESTGKCVQCIARAAMEEQK